MPVPALVRVAAALILAVTAVAAAPPPAKANDTVAAELQRAAYSADYQTGINRLTTMATANPADAHAFFAIGTLQLFGAVATMQEQLWRHNSSSARNHLADLRMLTGFLPLGFGGGDRAFLPPNPNARPMTYGLLRQVLTRFAADLTAAEATLAKVGDRPVKLPLQPLRIAIDLDHDGKIASDEHIFRVMFGLRAARQNDATIAFDTTDASWLRGYTHVLLASTNLILAFDFEKSYDAVAHNLYGFDSTAFGRELKRQIPPARSKELVQKEHDALVAKIAEHDARANVLNQQATQLRNRLNEIGRGPEASNARRLVQDEIDQLNQQHRKHRQDREALARPARELQAELYGSRSGTLDYGGILDVVASIHAMSWPVAEPSRLRAVRTHLLQVMSINRNTWRLARAETDDDREWLPNANQTPPFGVRPISNEIIDSWLETTALAAGVLNGEKLLPHPRFRRGINVKKMFETAKQIDLVMMITGHGLVPYLDDGEIVTEQTWRSITDPMQNQLSMYAVWFN